MAQFLNHLDSKITNPTIRHDSIDESIIAFSNQSHSTFHITDWECIDIKSGKIYSKQFRRFMISTLDKIEVANKNLGDEYINSLHDFLEQDTICGAII